MNSHTDLQQLGLESLMNDNDNIDKHINDNLHNGYVTNGIFFNKQPHSPPKITNKANLMR